LQDLKILSSRKEIRLTGEWPADLTKIGLSKDISFERPIPVGVEKEIGRDHVKEELDILSRITSMFERDE
jgi:hypothetical protein